MEWWIPNNWYTVSGHVLHRGNLQQTLSHFVNNHQSKGTHRFRHHPHRHLKLTIQDRLVMLGWTHGLMKMCLWSSWDNYELNDQIPNTETKKKKGAWTVKQNGTALVREKTHTKHLLKYTYHKKTNRLHDYLHMYRFQMHRIQIYAKLCIAHTTLLCAIYRTIETTRCNNDMENNAVCHGNQHCKK